MIGHLRGKVLRCTPEKLLLAVRDVGYEVHIPLSTFSEVERAGREGTVSLFIHTHVRDDTLELFGFWAEREKLLFEKLIAVSGIGPRLARVILSGMAADDLLTALADGDTGRLSSVPGVGKKTAERMVLELKDRVQELAAELPSRAASPHDDLVTALVNLGYKSRDAERAVADAREQLPEGDFHELLRASLKRLSRA